MSDSEIEIPGYAEFLRRLALMHVGTGIIVLAGFWQTLITLRDHGWWAIIPALGFAALAYTNFLVVGVVRGLEDK